MKHEAGRLEAIWIKRARRGPMDSVERAAVKAGLGLVGNADQGRQRQVTIIDRQEWDARVAGLDPTPPPSVRRANLMVSGVRLADSRGQVLHVGECRIRVLGETKPCERMDEAGFGLKDALHPQWGGGAFGEVLDDGEIAVGDPVFWSASVVT